MDEEEIQQNDQADGFELNPESFEDAPEQEEPAQEEAPEDEGSPEGEPEPAVGEEEKALDDKAEKTPQEEDVLNTFEIGKDLKLKVGQQLTADHLKELQRGYLRESDYTRKTQEVSQLRNEAQEVLTIRDQVIKNPQALREHLEDDFILQAFPPGELLARSLYANRIPAQAWNQFFESWQQENGSGHHGNFAPPQPGQPPQQPAVLGTFQKELKSVTSRIDKWEAEQSAKKAEEERQQETNALDKEVDSVVSKFPGMTKKELLRELALGDNRLTVLQIARNYWHERQAERNAHITRKEQVKQKALKKPGGIAKPLLPQQPKTFEEANDTLWDMAQAGEL